MKLTALQRVQVHFSEVQTTQLLYIHFIHHISPCLARTQVSMSGFQIACEIFIIQGEHELLAIQGKHELLAQV